MIEQDGPIEPTSTAEDTPLSPAQISPETVNSPERAAIETLTATAQRIFEQNTITPQSEYDIVPEDATLESVWSKKSGARLKRITSQNDDAAYQLSVLWHGGGDRGAFISAWDSSGDTLSRTHQSEVQGYTQQSPGTVKHIQKVLADLNELYPEETEQPQLPKQKIAKRILDRLLLGKT